MFLIGHHCRRNIAYHDTQLYIEEVGRTVAPGDIVKAALKRGLILIAAAGNVVRFLPPLIVSKEQIDEMAGILREAIAEASAAQA